MAEAFPALIGPLILLFFALFIAIIIIGAIITAIVFALPFLFPLFEPLAALYYKIVGKKPGTKDKKYSIKQGEEPHKKNLKKGLPAKGNTFIASFNK